MEIRQLLPEDFEESVSLSQYAFQYKLSNEDKEKARARFQPEQAWGIFDQGTLGARLTLRPLEIYVQGRAIPMGGIAGVATWPENRRQGLVAKLLSNTLETMNATGQSISFLHPFLIPFYRKFGWEIFCETKKYTIPVSQFPKKVEIPGQVRRDASEDLETIKKLYDRYAVRYNGTLKRTEAWWQSDVLDDESHYAVFYSEDGTAEGYILYKIVNRELLVDEFVHMNEPARQALWTFLANHDSMVTGATLTYIPSDDMLPFLLPDPRIKQENHPYFMARIVNVEAFVKEYTFNCQSAGGHTTVFIEDHYAPWNHGLWEWTVVDNGKAALVKIEGTPAQADTVISIGTLTTQLLGYKRPAELAKLGLFSANEDGIAWLEHSIPVQSTALFDFF